MEEGLRFAIREGGRTVGAGRVIKIHNKAKDASSESSTTRRRGCSGAAIHHDQTRTTTIETGWRSKNASGDLAAPTLHKETPPRAVGRARLAARPASTPWCDMEHGNHRCPGLLVWAEASSRSLYPRVTLTWSESDVGKNRSRIAVRFPDRANPRPSAQDGRPGRVRREVRAPTSTRTRWRPAHRERERRTGRGARGVLRAWKDSAVPRRRAVLDVDVPDHRQQRLDRHPASARARTVRSTTSPTRSTPRSRSRPSSPPSRRRALPSSRRARRAAAQAAHVVILKDVYGLLPRGDRRGARHLGRGREGPLHRAASAARPARTRGGTVSRAV
jgi:hypothetical protein